MRAVINEGKDELPMPDEWILGGPKLNKRVAPRRVYNTSCFGFSQVYVELPVQASVSLLHSANV